MNLKKIEDIKKYCGYLLVQTTEQRILNDMSFYLQTHSSQVREDKKKKSETDTSIDITSQHESDENKQKENKFSSDSKEVELDHQKRDVYNSSQSCYIIRTEKEVYVATSGLIFFNFLDQADISILEREYVLDLYNIQINAQFHISLENYPKEYIQVTPLKIVLDEDILGFFNEIKDKSFPYKNQAKINIQYDDRIVRNTSILFFKLKNDKDKQQLNRYLSYSSIPYSSKMPTQGQQILTISSPFGILSSQLYHNILGQGVIANVFDVEAHSQLKRFHKHILMLDMINFGGREGGLVLDDEQNVVGVILPSFSFQSENSVYFTFAISAKTVLELADDRLDNQKHSKNEIAKEVLETHSLFRNICLLKTKYGQFSGLIINSEGYILTARFGFDYMQQQQTILVYIIGYNKQLQAEIICISKGDNNLCLLKIKENIKHLNIKSLDQYIPTTQTQFKIGDEILSVGLEQTQQYKMPKIASGLITNCIKSENGNACLIQTNLSISNGYQGGALITKKGNKFIGMITVDNIQNQNYDVNFSLPYTIFDPLFTLIKNNATIDEILTLELWSQNIQEIRKIYSHQNDQLMMLQNIKPQL